MATASTSQWREMRAGSVLLVLSHFQPRLLTAPRSGPRAGFEAQFDPEAQGIPTGSSLLGRQVGEDDPGFFLLDVPDDQQGAAAFGSGGAEGGAATDPRGVGTGNEVLGGQPAASLGAEGDAFRIPHVGKAESSPPGGEFLSVVAGETLSCGIRAGGEVECWGTSVSGVPEGAGPFSMLAGDGGVVVCGLRAGDGLLVCWGGLRAGTPPGEFTWVSGGKQDFCGLRPDGEVVCW